MSLLLGLCTCSALFACGPTFATDDGRAPPPDAPTRPIIPSPDAGRDPGSGSTPSVLISEVRSRGLGGGSDEFVELYNATTDPITLDASWTLDARADTSASYMGRWTGTGMTIPGHGHFLLAGTAYIQDPAADEPLSTGITDSTALQLSHAGAVVDTVCYAIDATSLMTFVNDPTYGCEGTPVMNPHDASANTDASIERAPGGADGNGQDTDDNATDFAALTPADPQDSTSDPTP